MSDIAIKVENLGKKYIIGHQKEGDLRGSFGQKIKKLLGSNHGQTHEEFWAIKDISFEIKKGEAVGVIGRNGAGKSTLLKILSRITDPSTGRFEMNGRVSSLLEVGTGFHSELSGRENIYLNGTILGMKRREIKEKFDEIVAFSGVEKFIDTPVKHYSSGMKVRLAFSVAAHLEPEILIVDEVLAVGDAEFQKKCLGKMDEVSKNEGRTILFVSHNMSAIEYLCQHGILLNKGLSVMQCKIENVVDAYVKSETGSGDQSGLQQPLSNGVTLKELSFKNEIILSQADIEYTLTLQSHADNRITDLAILIYNHLNERIGIIDLRHKDLAIKSSTQREFTISGKIEHLPLVEGSYEIGLFLNSSLCDGDFLNLKRMEVAGQKQNFVPYATRYRGVIEFNNSFSIV